jgi:hypothetical protein
MKSFLAALLLAAAPLSAQDGPDSYSATPEQFPGQFARMRLELLYPKLVPETTDFTDAIAARPLQHYLQDTKPVLKNLHGLAAYLREGLKDPEAVQGSRRWAEAWERLDAELAALKTLVEEGDALAGGPAAPLGAGIKPEFNSPEGARLQRALDAAAYARDLRERLLRRAAKP